MRANQQTLSLVMRSAERFVIPQFQRPYCWTKDEVEQLWVDVFGAYEDSKSPASAGAVPDDYFLGPVVVAKRSETTGEVSAVVDGQQRLTTLHTLLWCARRRLDGNADGEAEEMRVRLDRLLLTSTGSTSLAVAKEDQANFLALQKATPVDDARPLGLTGNMLRESLAALSTTDLIAFLNFVLNRTTFILVETESYSSAWDLFIGLNGRVSAFPADLIKAFVCGTSNDSDAMADIWKDKVLPLEGDATSALLEVTRVATSTVGSDAKLFKLFEKAWGAKQIKDTLLSDGAMAYQQFWRTASDQVAVQGEGRRFLRGLRTLQRRDHSPLVVALGAKFGTKSIFKTEFLRCLEAFQLWMAIRGKRGKEREFTALGPPIYAASSTTKTRAVD